MAKLRKGNESAWKTRDWKGSYEKNASKTKWSWDKDEMQRNVADIVNQQINIKKRRLEFWN